MSARGSGAAAGRAPAPRSQGAPRGRSLAAALLLATGCAGLGGAAGSGAGDLATPPGAFPDADAGAPVVAPSPRAGWLSYTVGALRFEAPAGWSASGGGRRVTLEAAGEARLDAWVVDARFDDSKGCLAAAGESMERGAAQLSRVRRHASTLGGRQALVQEADSGGWHGWAWAVCHGAVQHRLFFTGRSPIAAVRLEEYRAVVASVRLGGAP